ncbi:hypothetical protein H2200_008992 [Cladophialophora chaetospira]|uniref:Uncharacterized protein n=1 Tax=Cladophialophora chaetospira TaxID=386627 RepID=A0AA38X547_9EURO|nr:hypothetical protein H2200_008992 [Cladophialophora chaetospira]
MTARSGLDMEAYNSEEDPFDSETNQPSIETASYSMPEGWEYVVSPAEQSVKLEGLGFHGPATPVDPDKSESASSRLNIESIAGPTPVKDWEMVPYEPDWHIVKRRETREARRATESILPDAEEQELEDNLPLEKPAATLSPTVPGRPNTPTKEECSQDKHSSSIPSSEVEAPSMPSNEDSMPRKPEQAHLPPTTDRHFPLLLPTAWSTPKHDADKPPSFSSSEKDLPFLPDEKTIPAPPPPARKAKSSKKPPPRGVEYKSRIIQRLRAMAEADPVSPGFVATVATRAAGARMDERLRRVERLPKDW